MTPEERHRGLCHALRLVMESICERAWAATWLDGWEYKLWERASSPARWGGVGRAVVAEDAALAALAEAIGGWLWWPDGAEGPQFIARPEWERRYAAKVALVPVQEEEE